VAKEDRLKYFETLESYAVEGNLAPFAEFIAELENREFDSMIETIQQVTE
jgi:hypothetical protein